MNGPGLELTLFGAAGTVTGSRYPLTGPPESENPG